MNLIFKIEDETEFKSAIEVTVLNCYNKNTNNTYESAKEEIQTIIRQTNCESTQLQKLLSQKGYKEERVLHLVDFIESKKHDLLYLSLINHNSKYGEAVSGFDWSLKFVTGTSERKNLKYTLVQLSITTYKNGAKARKTFDINRQMMTKFINALETTMKTPM